MEVKNYNQPVDAALFPEGCPRCSLLKFLLHLVPVAAVGLWGAYAAFRVLAYGLGETGLDDYFGFGLWITFDLAFIALGAGAFFTGALRYLLNIDALKNIINLTVVVGFLCYSGAMLVLVLDIGQPLRAWFGYWHPNVHSMLTEVIFCITCYCTVLIIEYVPLALENRQLAKNKLAHAIAHNFHLIMPLFAGIGAFLSTFHQGSLGGMYGVLFGRPYILRDGFFIWPWTFFLYILSAVGSGPMFTVLVCTFMEKLTGRRLVSWDVKQLMGKIAGTMFTIYMVFKLADVNGVPRMKLSEDPAKMTTPGRKNVYRLYGQEGYPLLDLVQLCDEEPPKVGERVLCMHIHNSKKRCYCTPSKVECLLHCIWDKEKGQVYDLIPLKDSRDYVLKQLHEAREDHIRYLNPTPYKVSASTQLSDYVNTIWTSICPITELD